MESQIHAISKLYLMRSELIDEVVHVNEEECKVINLFYSSSDIWSLHQNIQKIKKVDQDGEVEFLEFPFVVIIVWM